jgi:hypothetical protein
MRVRFPPRPPNQKWRRVMSNEVLFNIEEIMNDYYRKLEMFVSGLWSIVVDITDSRRSYGEKYADFITDAIIKSNKIFSAISDAKWAINTELHKTPEEIGGSVGACKSIIEVYEYFNRVQDMYDEFVNETFDTQIKPVYIEKKERDQ